MPDRRLVAGLTTVIAAVALAGCGGGASAPAASGGTRSTGAPDSAGDPQGSIKIVNFAFTPNLVRVKSGQSVTVTNDDSAVHTIKADDKSFDSKDLSQGKSYTFTAGKPGKYTYICDIHQYMKGTLEVS